MLKTGSAPIPAIALLIAGLGGAIAGAEPGAENRITPDQAARIKYSRQRFFYLDPGESCTFRLKDGREKSVRLESVEEFKDAVIGLARRAEAAVTVDGKPVRLPGGPYVMPVEVDGLRIQVDTTSGWLPMPKRVQLSLWDAADPIVDTSLFGFPLPSYSLFSHGTQAYGEPVHLGHGDGDPGGQRFHHDYGVDLAGYEGRQKVASCIDGTVVLAHRDDGGLCVRDERGVIVVFCHLDSILSEIREGTAVKRGQWVGMLGRRGASGNFSHLHVGIYLTDADMAADRFSRNIDLYPWLVEAYRAAGEATLLAVARPHQSVRTGEKVVFDGSRSLAFGSTIGSCRWEFDDGTRADGLRAERTYDKPGCYSAALWVVDGRGGRDVDFCTVRVFPRSAPEAGIPTLFATFVPAGDIRAGQPVSFRIWPQGAAVRSIEVDFGDGAIRKDCVPYSAIAHAFREPGIHVVTVRGSAGDMPVTQRLKVVVEE